MTLPSLFPIEPLAPMVLTARNLVALAFLAPGSSLALAQFAAPTSLAQLPNARAVHVVDLDGDTYVDVLVGNGSGSSAAELFSLPGDAMGGFGAPLLIASLSNGAILAIRTADLDGDGGLDILLVTAEGTQRLSSQLGGGFAAPELLVAGAFSSLEVADIDADGDLDALVGRATDSGSSFALINDGAGGLSTISLASTASAGIYPTDVDGDGDLDIVAASFFEATLHLNDGALGFTDTVVATYDFGVASVGDLDGDGDDDIVAAGFFGNSSLEWMENTGGGTFGPRQNIDTSGGVISAPRLLDVDGDGVNDLVLVQDAVSRIDWFQGLGGGNFGPRIVIDNAAVGEILGVPVDVDGDFDDDLLVSFPQGTVGRVDLYRNLSELGTAVCTAAANSSGAPGELTLTGSRSVGRNRLMANGESLPAGTVALIIAGRMQGMSMPAGSSGTLCIGGNISRLGGSNAVVSVTPAGTLKSAIDLTVVGGAVGGVMAGDLWLFQAWFRDANPSVTSNFTEAVEVTFEG